MLRYNNFNGDEFSSVAKVGRSRSEAHSPAHPVLAAHSSDMT